MFTSLSELDDSRNRVVVQKKELGPVSLEIPRDIAARLVASPGDGQKFAQIRVERLLRFWHPWTITSAVSLSFHFGWNPTACEMREMQPHSQLSLIAAVKIFRESFSTDLTA